MNPQQVLKRVPELKGKRYKFLVTGGAGFIGSHLAHVLTELEQEVVVLDNLCNGSKSNLPAAAEFIEGDIRDRKLLDKLMPGVDFVLHQAAIGSVPRSLKEPEIFHDVNVTGTFMVLEAARKAGVKRMIYASSSSVYGSTKEHPNREGHEGDLLSPYAVTKHTNEQYAQIQSRAFGFSTVGLRYFNVFGPRQNPHSQYAAVIPKFVTALMKGASPEIYGDGGASRDFTYVQNVVVANLRACFASKDVDGQVMNVACGATCSVNDLFNKIAAELGSDLPPRYADARPGEIRYSFASVDRAKMLIQYSPDVTLDEGLKLTVKWYLANETRKSS